MSRFSRGRSESIAGPGASRGAGAPTVITLVILIGLVLFVAVNSVYIVREWEQVVLTQFGEIRGEPVREAGLHFKMPFVQEVHRYERRLMRWDGQPFTLYTRDRRTIHMNVTARWRIEEPSTFLPSVRTVTRANASLYVAIEGALRDEIGKYDLYEVVRSSNFILTDRGELSLNVDAVDDIDLEEIATLGREVRELRRDQAGNYLAGRPVVVAGILQDARRRIREANLGIHLEDILIKQLNYTRDIESNVYAQMNAELAKISAGFRSHGRKNAEQKLGEMERELSTIESEAIQRSQEIRGRAEAEAIRIYADSYNADPDFYRFTRTLETFEKAMRANTALIFSTDSALFELLKQPAQEELRQRRGVSPE
jgi:modulator of FtsH protease HflC